MSLSLGLSWLVFQKLADNKRAKSINLRPRLPFEEWYDHFYGATSSLDKSDVQNILDSFGEAFGIDGTRIRPTDRLVEDLSHHHPLLLDDVWDCVDGLLAHRFRKHLRWKKDWKTVDDVIRGFCEQLHGTAVGSNFPATQC
jgi:hypothetical protein